MKQSEKSCKATGVRAALGVLALGGALLMGALATSNPAHAQSATCQRLQSQLVSLNTRGTKKQRRAFARSIRAQKKQIRSVSSKMSARGCAVTKRFFQREAHPSCGGLRSSLKRMNRNLVNLQKGASGGSNSTSRERSRIKRAMRKNLCGTRTASRDGIRRSSIMEQIFGGVANRRRREQAKRDRIALQNARESQSTRLESATRLKNYNTLRSVCVRTCDGYYFPVSFSTNQEGLEGDAQACNNLCPGREMKLYHHKTSTQWADDMVSYETGEPYSNLPTAFNFRKSYNPSCSCNYRLVDRRKEPLPKLTGLPQMVENQTVSTGKIGTPSWRDMADQDILRGASQLKRGTHAKLPPIKAPVQMNIPKPRIEMSQNRRVRIIGKSYFPTQ